jgi:uncharacterized protein
VLIGILSDTHGRSGPMAAAMAELRRAGAVYFIHCGDVGSTQVLDHMAGESAGFVFGNTDWERAELAAYAQRIGVACHGQLAELELAGKRIAVTHGDDFRLVDRLLAAQAHSYLLMGHTHVREDRRVGQMRVINPGALHRAARKSVALLDVETDGLSFHEIA